MQKTFQSCCCSTRNVSWSLRVIDSDQPFPRTGGRHAPPPDAQAPQKESLEISAPLRCRPAVTFVPHIKTTKRKTTVTIVVSLLPNIYVITLIHKTVFDRKRTLGADCHFDVSLSGFMLRTENSRLKKLKMSRPQRNTGL